jgi:hypothetical protein
MKVVISLDGILSHEMADFTDSGHTARGGKWIDRDDLEHSSLCGT